MTTEQEKYDISEINKNFDYFQSLPDERKTEAVTIAAVTTHHGSKNIKHCTNVTNAVIRAAVLNNYFTFDYFIENGYNIDLDIQEYVVSRNPIAYLLTTYKTEEMALTYLLSSVSDARNIPVPFLTKKVIFAILKKSPIEFAVIARNRNIDDNFIDEVIARDDITYRAVYAFKSNEYAIRKFYDRFGIIIVKLIDFNFITEDMLAEYILVYGNDTVVQNLKRMKNF